MQPRHPFLVLMVCLGVAFGGMGADVRAGTVAGPSLQAHDGFARWVSDFRPRAFAAGISDSVFQAAFATAQYTPEVIAKDRNQAEFSKTIWQYLDAAVSQTRIRQGRVVLARHQDVLNRIEAQFGVEKEIVVAVWGLESNYGRNRGSIQVISALASLAYDGRRAAFFEEQLIAALRILQAGDVAPVDMTGSWAGAMGHTQFIPASYLAQAVDFDGDGRRDIWGNDPTDALASTAAYLARAGWQKGQPWGAEVRLPKGFDLRLTGRAERKSVAQWAELGVRPARGDVMPDLWSKARAAILLPAGADGAAFMVFDNFGVIARYNAADSYVIAVGHLADRIAGQPPLRARWPRDQLALSRAENRELQQLLSARGFDTKGADGIIGPNTHSAIRAYQMARGLPADGYASAALLAHLR